MGFGEAIASVFGKYATFSGRAPRSEYWFFVLFNLIVLIPLVVIDLALIGFPILYIIYALAVFVPGLAVAVRRLHDLGKSGWFYLFIFIPLVGPILLLVWFCTPGTPGANQFGDNPLAGRRG